MTETVLTAVLVLWMLYDGYSGHGTGIFRWPMFTNHCAVVADLWVESPSGDRTPVNMFHQLPSDGPWITPREFDALLAFLAESGQVVGSGTFHGNTKTYDLEIADSRVDIAGSRPQFRPGHG